MSILDFIIAYRAQCPDRKCPDVPKVNFESFFIQSHVRLELLRKDTLNSGCALLRWQGTVLPNVISSKLFVFSFLFLKSAWNNREYRYRSMPGKDVDTVAGDTKTIVDRFCITVDIDIILIATIAGRVLKMRKSCDQNSRTRPVHFLYG